MRSDKVGDSDDSVQCDLYNKWNYIGCLNIGSENSLKIQQLLPKNLLNKMQIDKKFSILPGDFNLNLIKYSQTSGINKFLGIILSHNLIPQMTLSTRLAGRTATLTDDIISSYKIKYNSGNITTSVPDHLLQFLIIENFKGKTYITKNPKGSIRDYKKFNNESCQSDIKEVDWSLAT